MIPMIIGGLVAVSLGALVYKSHCEDVAQEALERELEALARIQEAQELERAVTAWAERLVRELAHTMRARHDQRVERNRDDLRRNIAVVEEELRGLAAGSPRRARLELDLARLLFAVWVARSLSA